MHASGRGNRLALFRVFLVVCLLLCTAGAALAEEKEDFPLPYPAGALQHFVHYAREATWEPNRFVSIAYPHFDLPKVDASIETMLAARSPVSKVLLARNVPIPASKGTPAQTNPWTPAGTAEALLGKAVANTVPNTVLGYTVHFANHRYVGVEFTLWQQQPGQASGVVQRFGVMLDVLGGKVLTLGHVFPGWKKMAPKLEKARDEQMDRLVEGKTRLLPCRPAKLTSKSTQFTFTDNGLVLFSGCPQEQGADLSQVSIDWNTLDALDAQMNTKDQSALLLDVRDTSAEWEGAYKNPPKEDEEGNWEDRDTGEREDYEEYRDAEFPQRFASTPELERIAALQAQQATGQSVPPQGQQPDGQNGTVAGQPVPVQGVPAATFGQHTTYHLIAQWKANQFYDVSYPQFGIPELDAILVPRFVPEIAPPPYNTRDALDYREGVSVTTLDDQYILLEFSEWEYAGGARGTASGGFLTFDTKAKRKLTLGDIFPQWESSKPKLEAAIKASLKDEHNEDSGSSCNTSFESTFAGFVLDKSGGITLYLSCSYPSEWGLSESFFDRNELLDMGANSTLLPVPPKEGDNAE